MTIKRKLLLAVVVLVGIAAAIVMIPLTTVVAIGIWIYLAWNIYKKRVGLFHEQMESELAAKRYKMLKTFLIIAAISVVAGIIGAVMHNVLYSVTEEEDVVSFIIALSTLWLFILLTGSSLAIYLTGQRKPDQ